MASKQGKSFQQCNHCRKPSCSTKLKACTGCYSVGYCSKECQRNDWRMHKLSCKNTTADVNAATASNNGYNEEAVRLEVKSNDSEKWRDVGPINLIDDMSELNVSGNVSTSTAQTKQTSCVKKDLPISVKSYLRGYKYKYRHSFDGKDTNLLLLLHGAGDTHEPYDKFATRMELPQTATLAVSAKNVELPLNLGYTWFYEMDCMGNTLKHDDKRRLASLCRAVDWLEHLLCLLIGFPSSDKNRISDNDVMSWFPEQIFILGFSAGACLDMELCRSWKINQRLPLGGAICVCGGIKTEALSQQNKSNKNRADDTNTALTDILIITGSNDETYSEKSAMKSKQLYGSSNVQLHVEDGKGHSMIENRNEMRAVMQFLSQRLVRRMTSMESMT